MTIERHNCSCHNWNGTQRRLIVMFYSVFMSALICSETLISIWWVPQERHDLFIRGHGYSRGPYHRGMKTLFNGSHLSIQTTFLGHPCGVPAHSRIQVLLWWMGIYNVCQPQWKTLERLDSLYSKGYYSKAVQENISHIYILRSSIQGIMHYRKHYSIIWRNEVRGWKWIFI